MKNLFLVAYLMILSTKQTSSSPIVNGFSPPIEPNASEFPFHANLLQAKSKDGNGKYFSFCGGSLIHPKWVLTAAHCIQLDENNPKLKPSEGFVAFGSIYRSAQNAQIVRMEKVDIHPNYLSSGGRHDVGIIKLRNSVKLGQNVKPIKLHTNQQENLIGKTVYLTGFGIINDLYQTPTRLRKAILHVSNYEKCYSEPAFRNVEICATSTVAEGKACKGDSGGPLFLIRNNQPIQIGITSHLALLPLCRISFNHSVYTKIAPYLDWIKKMTGIDFSRQ